uniref:non-specific serine/threonine protein kinase n=1 Tax=Astyanax mexicanus TaxID=7994 RepID=A0A8B9HAF0_ASTMX
METVGKFEFSRKDLIGHGAFAVVFKGRNREKHDWEVAVKWINKNNLPKSQSLSRKEIKILKELKHENIVALHDFQYCNGGDLADYLHSKGTLSEDTIRVFLQQIAGAMRVLQAKGIIHRDLKPQNILLSHPAGRKTHSNNTCIKIADFGFARHLQNNMMAATLCGSPMYMAPEVIMSQNYDAKADLWSIGTIVFQCLTGKAPFQVSTVLSKIRHVDFKFNQTILIQYLMLHTKQSKFHNMWFNQACPPLTLFPPLLPRRSCLLFHNSSAPCSIVLLRTSAQFTQDLSLLSFTAALQIPEAKARPQQQQQQGLGSRLHSAPCLLEAAGGCRQTIRKQHSDPVVAPQGGTLALRPLHSSPRLSELMQRSPLPTILGSPSRVCGHCLILFMMFTSNQDQDGSSFTTCMVYLMVYDDFCLSAGSSSSISPVGSLTSRYPHSGMCLDGYEGPSSPRYGLTGHISANIEGAVTFEAPELPEETLMEQEHTETLHRLRFTLDFARCMVEVAAARGGEAERAEPAPTCLHEQQSMVADQISSLSREWGYAEQLVLYMKTAELLSSALHTAMEGIKQGKLYPSSTVKQVVRRLNDLYKSSVMSCRSLSARLERFFSRKHRLMDHINSITAERLIFSHTVQMVQAAALDEMFHQGEASVQRYHKALLLMEGLSLLLTEQADLLNVSKCKYKHPYRKHLQQGSSNPVY